MINKIHNIDCLTGLKKLEDNTIDLCVTSPPYWALRDYGIEGQLGLESDFNDYINKLCDIFDGVKRVLKKTGSCFVNIGDTYYGSGKGIGTDLSKSKEVYQIPKEWDRPSRDNFNKISVKKICRVCEKEFDGKPNSEFCSTKCLNTLSNKERTKNRKLKSKCLIGIPFRFALEMINRGWILRNTIIWNKPNCMPSSVKDRFTVDFEYVFFFVKNKKYYFEQQFDKTIERYSKKHAKRPLSSHGKEPTPSGGSNNLTYNKLSPLWKNKRTVWKITTKPFKEAHFATYPEDLILPIIKSSCPEYICKSCGEPRKTIYEYEKTKLIENYEGKATKDYNKGMAQNLSDAKRRILESMSKKIKNKTFTNCGCNKGFESGIVLDPFMGAGTTALVSLKNNKRFIGFEINKDYIKIANKRIANYKTKLNEFL